MSAALQLATSMSDAEWETRCELAAVYHVCHHLGWTDLINTHMSARVPGEPGYFLINNYGEMFDEITASSLVKMDMSSAAMRAGSTPPASPSTAASTRRAGMRIACCTRIRGPAPGSR